MTRELHLPKSYTDTGDKIIHCRGRSDDLLSFYGICFYPIAFSDGKTFDLPDDEGIQHRRRGKVRCPRCGYVTTLTPKML